MGKRIKLGPPLPMRNIGEQFVVDGVLYEVAEAVNRADPCDGCSFQNEKGLVCRSDIGVTGFCYRGMRGDDRQVVFKEVRTDKPIDSLLNGDFTGETSEVWPNENERKEE